MAGRTVDDLWFMSAGGEHVFHADGRAKRIEGQRNRVQFFGSCVLEDAPDRLIQVQGTADVTLDQDHREEVDSISAESESSEREDWSASYRRRRAIQCGRIVIRRDAAVSSSESSSREEESKSARSDDSDRSESFDLESASAEEDEEGRLRLTFSDLSLSGLTNDELEDSVFLRTPKSIMSRLKEAIARGQIAAKRGGAVGEDEEDHPSLVTPVRRLPQRDGQESEDDPFMFSPLRPVFYNRHELEMDTIDSPDVVSPVRRLKHTVRPDEPRDDPFALTPLQRRRSFITSSPVTAREPDTLSNEEMDLLTAPELSDEEESNLCTAQEASSEETRDSSTAEPWSPRIRIAVEQATLPSDSTTAESESSESSATFVGSTSTEEEELAFPVDVVREHLEDESRSGYQFSRGSIVFASGVVEYLTRRVLVHAVNNAMNDDRDQLILEDVAWAMDEDPPLREMLQNVILPADPPSSDDDEE